MSEGHGALVTQKAALISEVGAPHSAGPPQPSTTSPEHINLPAPRPVYHRHRPKDAPSRDSKHQAPPSHTGVTRVLADLSMTPVAPCGGLPFAATGLPGLQPRAPPSSPSLPFTLHMRKGESRWLSGAKRDR